MRKKYNVLLCTIGLAVGLLVGTLTATVIDSAAISCNNSPNVNVSSSYPVFFGKNKDRLPKSSSKEIQKIMESAVSIRIEIRSELVTVASGVIFEDNNIGPVVLTAEHVSGAIYPGQAYACSIITDECVALGSSFVTEVDTGDIASDWSIYRLSKLPKGSKAIKKTSDGLGVGDKVWMAGHPFARMPWISSGTVAWQWRERGSPMYAIDGFAAPGFSGGGVFNEDGDLVGIVSALVSGIWGPQTQQVLVVPINNFWVLDLD